MGAEETETRFFLHRQRDEGERTGLNFHQSDGAIKYLGYGPFGILALPW